jgi:hypothetical protein
VQLADVPFLDVLGDPELPTWVSEKVGQTRRSGLMAGGASPRFEK